MPSRARFYRPAGAPKRPTPSEATRGDRHERGYTAHWSLVAKAYLREHPLCVLCAGRGRVEAATCVDHIDGKGPLGERGYDPTNFRSLCHSCHSRATVRSTHAHERGQ